MSVNGKPIVRGKTFIIGVEGCQDTHFDPPTDINDATVTYSAYYDDDNTAILEDQSVPEDGDTTNYYGHMTGAQTWALTENRLVRVEVTFDGGVNLDDFLVTYHAVVELSET